MYLGFRLRGFKTWNECCRAVYVLFRSASGSTRALRVSIVEFLTGSEVALRRSSWGAWTRK